MVNRVVFIMFAKKITWYGHPNSVLFSWECPLCDMLVVIYKSHISVRVCEYTSICPWRNNASTALICKVQTNSFAYLFFCFRKPVVEMKSGTPAKKKKHCNCKNSQCLKLWVHDFLFQSCTSFIKTLNVVEWYTQMYITFSWK